MFSCPDGRPENEKLRLCSPDNGVENHSPPESGVTAGSPQFASSAGRISLVASSATRSDHYIDYGARISLVSTGTEVSSINLLIHREIDDDGKIHAQLNCVAVERTMTRQNAAALLAADVDSRPWQYVRLCACSFFLALLCSDRTAVLRFRKGLCLRCAVCI